MIECQGNGETADGVAYLMMFSSLRNSNEYFCTKLVDEVLLPIAQALGAPGTERG